MWGKYTIIHTYIHTYIQHAIIPYTLQVSEGLRAYPGRYEVHQQGHHQADQIVSEFVHYHQSQERPAPEKIGEHVW